jgi:hypothetical protein
VDLRKTDPGPRFVLDGRLLCEQTRVIDTTLPQYATHAMPYLPVMCQANP